MKKRASAILNVLAEYGRIEVAALAERLGVSQVTIRKDLDALEEQGVVRREHGYAVFGGLDDISNRLAFHYEEKKRIAREASKLVSAGETVMIESGSCCALLAEELAREKPGVTIITNSAFIANYIRKLSGAHVVLLGGDFQNDAQVMVGPVLKSCLDQFYVDKLFIGIDGYTPELGFSGNDHLRAQAVRDMSEHAQQLVVVTESQKFSQRGVVPLRVPGKLGTVVTDASLPPEAEALLSQGGVSVVKAGAPELL